ncbi:hypothetical protein SNEBB_004839 [Seison nebaliae]|nr:hypothetical protein SNEBB_004839 [Seison nebaliae]
MYEQKGEIVVSVEGIPIYIMKDEATNYFLDLSDAVTDVVFNDGDVGTMKSASIRVSDRSEAERIRKHLNRKNLIIGGEPVSLDATMSDDESSESGEIFHGNNIKKEMNEIYEDNQWMRLQEKSKENLAEDYLMSREQEHNELKNSLPYGTSVNPEEYSNEQKWEEVGRKMNMKQLDDMHQIKREDHYGKNVKSNVVNDRRRRDYSLDNFNDNRSKISIYDTNDNYRNKNTREIVIPQRKYGDREKEKENENHQEDLNPNFLRRSRKVKLEDRPNRLTDNERSRMNERRNDEEINPREMRMALLPTQTPKVCDSIVIKNISLKHIATDFRKRCLQFGPVLCSLVEIVDDEVGDLYLKYKIPQDAQKAKGTIHGLYLDGNKLIVEEKEFLFRVRTPVMNVTYSKITEIELPNRDQRHPSSTREDVPKTAGRSNYQSTTGELAHGSRDEISDTNQNSKRNRRPNSELDNFSLTSSMETIEPKLVYNNLLVLNLNPKVSPSQLSDLISKYATPRKDMREVSAKLPNGQHIRAVLLRFSTYKEVEKIMKLLNFTVQFDQEIRLHVVDSDQGPYLLDYGNLKVSNLPRNITNSQFYHTFEQFGPILSCHLDVDNFGSQTGVGWINYKMKNDVPEIQQAIKNKVIGKNKINAEITEDDYRCLCCRGFGHIFTDETLTNFFRKFGEISDAYVKCSPDGDSRGFGFIHFVRCRDAATAKEVLHNSVLPLTLTKGIPNIKIAVERAKFQK